VCGGVAVAVWQCRACRLADQGLFGRQTQAVALVQQPPERVDLPSLPVDHGAGKEFPVACRPRWAVLPQALSWATLRGEGGDSVSASGDAAERLRPRTARKALANPLRKRLRHAKGLTPGRWTLILHGRWRHTNGSTKRLRRGR